MNVAGSWPSTQMTLLGQLLDHNDSKGWERFWEVYSPLVYRFCLKRSLQHADALDVSQNCLLALRSSVCKFDPAKGKFRGWFGQLIRRELFRFRTKQLRDVQGVGGDYEPPEDLAEDGGWEKEFTEYIMQLAVERIRPEFDQREWMVMELVVLSGCKPREVTSKIGRDTAWISRVKYILVKRLKKEVGILAHDEID